jgi:hypothetical protein
MICVVTEHGQECVCPSNGMGHEGSNESVVWSKMLTTNEICEFLASDDTRPLLRIQNFPWAFWCLRIIKFCLGLLDN